MKKILISLLIGTFAFAGSINNNPITNNLNNTSSSSNVRKKKSDNSFDEMLKILQEKEDLQNKNKQLQKRINTLETANSANQKNYDSLLEQFQSIKKNKKNSKIEMNQLLEDEKQNRLPIPYLIINNYNHKYAKVLKLHWYYTSKDKVNVFNGYYYKDEIKLNNIIMDYKVKSINDNSITYCSTKEKDICISKNILPLNLKKELLSLKIIDGVPNQLLTSESQLTPLITKLLKKTNPITKSEKEKTKETPKDDTNNNQGQSIPKNNIPNMGKAISSGNTKKVSSGMKNAPKIPNSKNHHIRNLR